MAGKGQERRERATKSQTSAAGENSGLSQNVSTSHSVNLGFISTKPEMIAEGQTKIVLVSFTMSETLVKEEKLELRRCIIVFFFRKCIS